MFEVLLVLIICGKCIFCNVFAVELS